VAGFSGVVLGSLEAPRLILIKGYEGAVADFAGWLAGLRAVGWEVTVQRSPAFDGYTIEADPPGLRS
jgi:hypothetical protein